MENTPRLFQAKDAAQLAYAMAFTIDLTRWDLDYDLQKIAEDGINAVPNLKISSAINTTCLLLRDVTTITTKDHKQVIEWFNVLFKLRVRIACGHIVNTASVENRSDLSSLYGGLFGLRDLPSEIEVALLNSNPGDSSRIRHYSTLFRGVLQEEMEVKQRKERFGEGV